LETDPHPPDPASVVRPLGPLFAALALLAFGLLAASPADAQEAAPPPITILEDSGSLGAGLIFVGPQDFSAPYPNQGPEIIDNEGRPVWFLPTPGDMSTDFRVQTYNGNPVLTWSQGLTYADTKPGDTTDYIMDSTYAVIAKVQAGNGYNADIHEFQVTPQNTAIIAIYNNVSADLSSLGGPVDGTIQEGVVQEIDIPTGSVLFEWHSLPNVALGESYYAYTPGQSGPYDYFHINSVKLDTDGNLLISARHTWTVYKVNRTTGAMIWRLGGKKSDFTLGAGLPFAWQHDVEAADSQTLRIFDNESDGVPVLPYSRVIWVQHDDTAMTASVTQSIVHPAQLSVLAEGSAQTLSNGDTLVEWGILGRISEFSPAGQLLWDASEATGYGSYRGFRFQWTGSPTTQPTAAAYQGVGASIDVHAIWNGATQVATWDVYGGTTGALSLLVSAPWNGLDTTISIPTAEDAIQVVALDASGNTLGTSATISGPFPSQFETQPASQTIAAGSTVVLRALATGASVTYQWLFNGNPLSNGTVGGAAISGVTSATLVINGSTAANAGSYVCTATSAGNSVASNPASLAVVSTASPGRLVDVSCRAQVGTGANELIVGFVVGGLGTSGDEPLLIRASGPALAQFGVAGVLADPELTLDGPGGVLATDAGWDGNAQIASAAASVGAFAWTNTSSLDSALSVSLPGGTYTAQIAGASGDTGVALAEVYDATPAGTYTPASPRLINISARDQVGTGGNILIAGFVIGGTTSKTVLVRGSGPALAAFGLSGTLADPQLQLFQSVGDGASALIQSNTGWGGDAGIAAAAAYVGAFSWGSSMTADSAILVTLPPGTYTAQVSGASGDTGIALVEVYALQ
jgi:hypothetical protein